MGRWDLNADVGEGFPYDADLMTLVSQANVACGFHAGDPLTMRALCRLAVRHEVEVGAQASYRDREHFGRRDLDVPAPTLRADLDEQVEVVRAAAHEAGTVVGYLKPHGALYNRIVHDEVQAAVVVAACADAGLPLMCLPGSVALRLAADAGVPTRREFFADRAYDDQARLVPRATEGSVLHDVTEVAARVRQLLRHGTVTSSSGRVLPMLADSICVHGDTPGAVGLARAVRAVLDRGVDGEAGSGEGTR